MRSDNVIKLSDERKTEMVEKMKAYFDNELGYELGQFDAEFLLDFIMKELGQNVYNQALWDMQTMLKSKFEEMDDIIYQLEKH